MIRRTNKTYRSLAMALAMVFIMLAVAVSGVYAEDAGTENAGKSDAEMVAALLEEKDEASLVLDRDMEIEKSVVIPGGKKLTIKDDGTKRTIKGLVSSMFRVEGELVIKGTSDDSLVVEGTKCAGREGTVATIAGGKVTFASGTVKGGLINVPSTGAFVLFGGGILDMTGGVITGTTMEDYYNAPIRLCGTCTVNISGGEITKNVSSSGAGILTYIEGSDHATVNISGGSISDNVAGSGGAITATSNTTINISGGRFENNKIDGRGTIKANQNAVINFSGGRVANNTATSYGGGFHISASAKLVMTGGEIVGNSSERSGGGVFVETATADFLGGLIEGNTSKTLGGGIYVNNYSKEEAIMANNVVVKDNEATHSGGGVWCCPTGQARIYATEGMAIYDNKAAAAGDDFVNVYTEEQLFPVFLASRVLGGGQVAYHNDGELDYSASKIYGIVPEGAKRFDAAAPGEPVVISDNQENSLALKAVLSDDAKAAAERESKLIIRGNKAKSGGGIASNASVYTKKTMESPDEWEYEIKKEWDGIPDEERKPVTIDLMSGDLVIETVELSEENDWKAVVKELPDPATLSAPLTVKERNAEGYEVDYGEETVDQEARRISRTVTNRPEKPEEPSEEKESGSPEAPGKQEKVETIEKEVITGEPVYKEEPTETLKGRETEKAEKLRAEPEEDTSEEEVITGGTTEKSGKASVSPKTGDSSDLMIYVMMLAAALLAAGLVKKAGRR